MTEAKSRHMDLLLNAPIPSLLWRLAAPNVTATVILTAVTVADALFVGFLGTAALASLALVFPFQTLTQMMAGGAIGGAVTSAVARALGAGDREHANVLAWHAVVVACGMALPFVIVLGLLPATVFALLGGSGDVLNGAVRYAQIAFGGVIVTWLFYVLAAILRGTGDIATPVRAIIATSLLQVGLSGVLTLGFGPVPSFGIMGPAIAMVLCQGLAVAYMAVHLFGSGAGVQLRFGGLRLRPFADIMSVGAIGLVHSAALAGTVVVVTALVGTYGTAALAGYGLGGRLELMLVPIVFGIGGALTASVGANFGAGQFARARRIAWAGAGIAMCMTGMIGFTVTALPGVWLDRFTADPDAYAIGALYLAIAAPFYGIFGGGQALYFASQGTGRLVLPVTVSTSRFALIAIVGSIAIAQKWDLSSMFVGVAVGLVFMGVGQALCLFGPGWRPDDRLPARAVS
ncbi:MAG: MATE family efflux transporter [Pseudomonadota bacterium]